MQCRYFKHLSKSSKNICEWIYFIITILSSYSQVPPGKPSPQGRSFASSLSGSTTSKLPKHPMPPFLDTSTTTFMSYSFPWFWIVARQIKIIQQLGKYITARIANCSKHLPRENLLPPSKKKGGRGTMTAVMQISKYEINHRSLSRFLTFLENVFFRTGLKDCFFKI